MKELTDLQSKLRQYLEVEDLNINDPAVKYAFRTVLRRLNDDIVELEELGDDPE